MQQIGNILLIRFKDYKDNPKAIEDAFKKKGLEHNKKWNEAVGFFMDKINKERVRDGYKPLPFMSYRQKLAALKELDDLRWFWFYCGKTSSIKDLKGNNKYSFGQIFFNSLKVK